MTGMPAAAKRKETADEILKLPDLSPPVPHKSIPPSTRSSISGSEANFRNSLTKAENSSVVSPFSASDLRNENFSSSFIPAAARDCTARETFSFDKEVPDLMV